MAVTHNDAHRAIIVLNGLIRVLEASDNFKYVEYTLAHQQVFMLKAVSDEAIVYDDIEKFWKLCKRLDTYEEEVAKGLRR